MRAPTFLEFLQAGDDLFRKLAEVGIHNQEDLRERIDQIKDTQRMNWLEADRDRVHKAPYGSAMRHYIDAESAPSEGLPADAGEFQGGRDL